MAFSTAERATLLELLGLPGTPDNISLFQATLDSISLDSSVETQVKARMTTIATLQTAIATSVNTAGSAYPQQAAEAQTQVYAIAAMLGIKVERKRF